MFQLSLIFVCVQISQNKKEGGEEREKERERETEKGREEGGEGQEENGNRERVRRGGGETDR